MTNLKTFDNLYASLSQSTYEDRPNAFFHLIKDSVGNVRQINYSINKNENNEITYGGQNLPNNGVLYVHKDTTVYKAKVKFRPDEEYFYEKGLLKDESAGFNAYFATDTPKLDASTKNVYLAAKGSDGPGLHSANDWVESNAFFTLHDAYTPQGKLVENALHVKLAEMREKSPNVK